MLTDSMLTDSTTTTTTTTTTRSCAICGGVLQAEEPVVKTGQAIFEAEDPLWRVSNSSAHAACFHRWAGTPVSSPTQSLSF